MKRKQIKSPKRRFTFWSVVVILLLVFAVIGPLFMPHDPFEVNLAQVNMAPCREYPLGTDYIGRCILCRLIEGAARSIYSALIVVAITFVIGTSIGTLSGFFGGPLDTVLMRVVDCFQAFPSMVFIIAVAGMLGIGTKNCIIAMSVIGWTGYARLARSQVLSVKERTFVSAARISGCSTPQILLRTILPNSLSPLVVYASMHIGGAILSFAGLSFLGLGTAPPYPEWGTMLSDGRVRMQTAPWAVIFPGLAILLVVMIMGMFGDSVNEMLNPKKSERVETKKYYWKGRIMKKVLKLKKVLAVVFCMLLMSFVLTGCGGSESEVAEPIELTIPSATNAHGITLDPQIDYCASHAVSLGICETLFKLDNDTMEVKSHLANGYKQLDDYTWEITIQDGINFTSGNPLTAEAVKSAFEYSLEGIDRIATMLDLNSIEADGQVLTIKTNSIVATLPAILTDGSMLIYDTAAVSDYTCQIVGTGPYILKSMDADGNCELVKNKDYWQGEPGVDIIHTKWITDGNAKVMALQSGELDYSDIASGYLTLFENNDDYEIISYDSHRAYFLFLNPEHIFTADDALRSALCYSIDRDSYIESIFNGNGTKTTACFPLWSGFSDGISAEEYDIEKAKQILTDAGYQDTNGDGNLEKDGQEVFLTIMTYAGNAEFPVLCEVIQAQLASLGIGSKIVVSDSIVKDLTKGNWNIATYGYNTLSLGDSYNFLEPVFYTDAFSNFTHFSNSNVDALLDKMKATSDVKKRKELSIEIQKYIFEADQHIFILHLKQHLVVRKGVENVKPHLGNDFDFWKITKTKNNEES